MLGGLIEGALFLREVGVAVNVDVIASVEGGGSRAPSAAIGCAGRCARPGDVPTGLDVASPLQLVIDQQEQISWPARTQMEINNGGESQSRLKVGAYVTNISDFDLLDDQFSIELLLWTLWDGAAEPIPVTI